MHCIFFFFDGNVTSYRLNNLAYAMHRLYTCIDSTDCFRQSTKYITNIVKLIHHTYKGMTHTHTNLTAYNLCQRERRKITATQTHIQMNVLPHIYGRARIS